jgi:hypothetical protein
MEEHVHNVADQGSCPTLCRSGCGFFGSPAFEGLCSKCYRDYQERKDSQGRLGTSTASTSSPSQTVQDLRQTSEDVTASSSSCMVDVSATSPSQLTASPPVKSPHKRNRCHMCRKKVGLTGFDCRCGNLYCSLHRYADKHNCTFDYRAMGRQEVEKHNPKIIASKIQKI